MFCEGLPAENYDLYVAGNADEEVRRDIDAHLDRNCPACFRGVRRSVALWATYAAALEPAKTSGALRSRVVAMGAASPRTIGFRTPPNLSGFGSLGLFGVLAASVAMLVAAGAWYAGVQYETLRNQQVVADLSDAQQSSVQLRTKLGAETLRRQQVEEALKKNGQPDTTGQMQGLRQQVLRLQAEVNQYRQVMDRERNTVGENAQLLALLSTPGVSLVTLHGPEASPGAVAYSLILENQKLVLIASHLPKPSPGKEYQLWLLRKEDPKVVSGGIFDPEDSDRAMVAFNTGDLVSQLSGIAVTEEPMGGSEGPTGPKLLSGAPDAP